MALAHGRAGLRAAPARMGALRAVLYFPCAACGAVAQSGEHLLCKQGVRGSNPLSSTKTNGKHNSSVEDDLSGVRSPYGAIVRRGDSVAETALPGLTLISLTKDLVTVNTPVLRNSLISWAKVAMASALSSITRRSRCSLMRDVASETSRSVVLMTRPTRSSWRKRDL